MDKAQLLADIKENLSESDVRSLLGRLDIPPELMTGYDLQQRIELLFTAAQNAERLPKLAAELVRLRPYLAPRYETVDPLSWIDQTQFDPAQITPPQITTEIEKLRSLPAANSESGGVQPQRTTQENLGHLYESPTAVWDTATNPKRPTPLGIRHFGAKNNPFQAGGVIEDPDKFFGRDLAQRQILDRLQQMKSSAVVALPGAGKSSLLHQIARHQQVETSWRFLFSIVDVHSVAVQPVSLLQQAVNDWFAALGQGRAPVVHSVADFARHVRFLGQSGHRPVLCLDNVDRLWQKEPPPADLVETWETLSKAGRLALVVTSPLPIAVSLRQTASAGGWANQFAEIYLGELSDSAARGLLLARAEERGKSIPGAVLQELFDFCGRLPYLLQLGAFHVYPLLKQTPVPSQWKKIVEQEAVPFWRAIWERLTPMQRQLLTQPIQRDAPVVVGRQYRKLAQLGILREQNDGGFVVSSRCGAEWLKGAQR